MFDRNVELVREDMEQHTDYECHKLCRKYPDTLARFSMDDETYLDSGKVTKLVELLTHFVSNGDRTLVFSQFTSVLDLLEPVLSGLSISFFRLDGETPIPDRQDMLDEFSRDKTVPVFMLSTKSGGTGINLAAANKVIIFDSSFNPHDDVQAENRAHRVGQTREVEVVRLVSRGTVEEQILKLGMSKIVLDERVAGEGTEGLKDEELYSKGVETVEKMMKDEMIGDGSTPNDAVAEGNPKEGNKQGSADLREQYMKGLRAAGLDLSAAA